MFEHIQESLTGFSCPGALPADHFSRRTSAHQLIAQAPEHPPETILSDEVIRIPFRTMVIFILVWATVLARFDFEF
jgi:hypothetical protein